MTGKKKRYLLYTTVYKLFTYYRYFHILELLSTVIHRNCDRQNLMHMAKTIQNKIIIYKYQTIFNKIFAEKT